MIEMIEKSNKRQFRIIQISIRLCPRSLRLLINLVFLYLHPGKVQFDGKNYFQSTPVQDFQSIDNKVT